MTVAWFEALLIVSTSVGAALIALLATGSFGPRNRPRTSVRPDLEPAVFLFEDEYLVDATAPARSLLAAIPTGETDWARFSAFVAPRFPDFTERMRTLGNLGKIEMRSSGGDTNLHLQAEDMGGLARIMLTDRTTEGSSTLIDGLSLRAMEEELDLTRAVLDGLPVLSWREDDTGKVTWANRSYVLMADAFDPDGPGAIWPLPRLFPVWTTEPGCRVSLNGPDNRPIWYDAHRIAHEGGWLCYALPADALVRAESSLRDFIQTLSKTFADLPIGLAIFDRKRQLQLFNPALTDLTLVPSEFLLARPTLHAFLDRLRETRMMPEPRDYISWRQRMTDLEAAAASGFHSETWSLPRGQTYRVTGRPHPDGAVAFLFEDISSEIAVTRRFRAELELSQNVFDRLDTAIAVFGATGDLMMSNAPYDRLWGVEPESSLGRVTWLDSIALWQRASEPAPFWTWAKAFAPKSGPVEGAVQLNDGRTLACRIATIPGGAVMASFSAASLSDASPQWPRDHPIPHHPQTFESD